MVFNADDYARAFQILSRVVVCGCHM